MFSIYPPITEPKTTKYSDVDNTGDRIDCPIVLMNLFIS
jgi:hypothetical protein